MRAGALAETVTVAGESPIVDTQSVRRQAISSDLLTSIPSARSWAARSGGGSMSSLSKAVE